MALKARDKGRLVSLEEALSRIFSLAAPLTTESVRLENARGRVLAEEVRAWRNEPSSPRAAMDGYALRSADVQGASPEKVVVLEVKGEVSAGEPSRLEVSRGEAVRVMTGSSVPVGADAVAPREDTRAVAQRVRVMAPVARGDNIIPVGAELQRDERLLSSGTVLRPLELTVLAALGRAEVIVRRQPRVAVLASGNELAMVGASPAGEKVFASNLHTVAHLVNRCGGTATSLGIASDDVADLTRGIEAGTVADVIVTTGGTGQGEKDLITAAVASLAGELLFRGVAMKPGKQTLFAEVGGTLLFGLPGRPSAVYIAFEQLVRPALLRLLNVPLVLLPEITARLSHSIRRKGRVFSFVLSRLSQGAEGPQVRALRSDSEGIWKEMLGANSLLKLPPGKERIEAGEKVEVQLLDLGLEGMSYFSSSRRLPGD